GFVSNWYELCLRLATQTGGEARIHRLPVVAALAAALIRELGAQPGQPCWPSLEAVGMLCRTHLVDDSVSRRELTWSPQICAFEEALKPGAAPLREPEAAPAAAPARLPFRATSRRGRSRS